MISELTRLANHLDAKGLRKEADYLDGIIREANEGYTEEQMAALRRSSPDIKHNADVIAAALTAIDQRIPSLTYQVTEEDVKIILSNLYRAGYQLVKL